MNNQAAFERLMIRIEQALCADLNETEASELAEHLFNCENCESEIQRVKALRQLLQNSCGCEAPSELKEKIRIQYQQIRIEIRDF